MNLRRILAWLAALVVSGMSIYSTYLNFKETTAVSSLLSSNLRDTTLLILSPTPEHLSGVRSFVNTSLERLEIKDTLQTKLSAVHATSKQHLFPLNTNNEKDEHFLVFKPEGAFTMTKECERVAVDSHHDTVMLCQTSFFVGESDKLYTKLNNCPPCDTIKAYGNCSINADETIEFTFFTLPSVASVKQPYISFMKPGADVPINSETRRFYAEDIQTELPIKLDAKTLVDIHVLNLNCESLMYIEEDEEPTFKAAYFQLVQPSMLWSKRIPINLLPAATIAATSAEE